MFDKLSSMPALSAPRLSRTTTRAARALIRAGIDAELQQARQQAIDLAKEMQSAVELRSDDLTAKSHRVIRITWLVMGLGIIFSFSSPPTS